MSPDQIDELAHFRARRNRDRRAPDQDSAGETPWSAEQGDGIARARESWALSQLGREAHPRRGPDPSGLGTSGEDD